MAGLCWCDVASESRREKSFKTGVEVKTRLGVGSDQGRDWAGLVCGLIVPPVFRLQNRTFYPSSYSVIYICSSIHGHVTESASNYVCIILLSSSLELLQTVMLHLQFTSMSAAPKKKNSTTSIIIPIMLHCRRKTGCQWSISSSSTTLRLSNMMNMKPCSGLFSVCLFIAELSYVSQLVSHWSASQQQQSVL